MDFEQAFERLIGHEGGYVFHPNDPGGETKWGISKNSYPHVDIKRLTREDARLLYRRDFWQRAKMDQINSAVAYQVFDAAVNHGIGNAVRFLQRSVGVADDGRIGPVTIAAVNSKSVTDILMLLSAERIEFWCKLSTWETFGRGWARRAAANLRYAAQDA